MTYGIAAGRPNWARDSKIGEILSTKAARAASNFPAQHQTVGDRQEDAFNARIIPSFY